MANCFGVSAVQCTAGLLMVTYSDAGDCKIAMSDSVFYEFNSTITIPTDTNTQIPGTWNIIYGDISQCGLILQGNVFKNITGGNLNINVTIQAAWWPVTPVGTVDSTRSIFCVRNGSLTDIPLAAVTGANDTSTVQSVTNTIRLANGGYFQPYVYQNSGVDAFIGDASQLAKTTIFIERVNET